MKKPLFLATALLSIGSFVFGDTVFQGSQMKSENDKWPMYIQVDGKKGNLRDILRLSLLAPIWQDDSSMLFGDVRFMMDNIRDREGNVGLGYRKIIRDWNIGSDGVILGAYAYYDRKRSPLKNWFNQLTMGVEALGEYFRVYGNYYLPQNKEYTISSSLKVHSITPRYTANDRILVSLDATLGTMTSKEVSLKGYDYEGRVKVPLADNLNVWAGAGGYRFSRKSLKSSGPLAMGDLEFTSVLSSGDRFSIGYEYRGQRKVGDTAHYGVVKYATPLAFLSEASNPKFSGIDYEMTRFVERDLDVISGQSSEDSTVSSFTHSIDLNVPATAILPEFTEEERIALLVRGLVQGLEQSYLGSPSVMILASANDGDDFIVPEGFFSQAVTAVSASEIIPQPLKFAINAQLNQKNFPCANFVVTPFSASLLDIAVEAVSNEAEQVLAKVEGLNVDQDAINTFRQSAAASLSSHQGGLLGGAAVNPAHIRNPYGAFTFLGESVTDVKDSVLQAVGNVVDGVMTPAFQNIHSYTIAKGYEGYVSGGSGSGTINIDNGAAFTFDDYVTLLFQGALDLFTDKKLTYSNKKINLDGSLNDADVVFGGEFAMLGKSTEGDTNVPFGDEPFNAIDMTAKADIYADFPDDVSVVKSFADVSLGLEYPQPLLNGNLAKIVLSLSNVSNESELNQFADRNKSLLSDSVVVLSGTSLPVVDGVPQLPTEANFSLPTDLEGEDAKSFIGFAAAEMARAQRFNQEGGASLDIAAILDKLIQEAPEGAHLANMPESAVNGVSAIYGAGNPESIRSTYQALSPADKPYVFPFLTKRPSLIDTRRPYLSDMLENALGNIDSVKEDLDVFFNDILELNSDMAGDAAHTAFLYPAVNGTEYGKVIDGMIQAFPDSSIDAELLSAKNGEGAAQAFVANAVSVNIALGDGRIKDAITEVATEKPQFFVDVLKVLSGLEHSSDSQQYQKINPKFVDTLYIDATNHPHFASARDNLVDKLVK